MGGGHAPGTGRRGASEFPAGWSRERIMDAIVDVAKNPDEVPRRQHNGRWRAAGMRDGVDIVVLLEQDGRIHTACPTGGSGVTRNPDAAADPAGPTVDDLAAGRLSYLTENLLDQLADRISAVDLVHYRSLHWAGEWSELADILIAHVDAESIALGAEERADLDALR